jgi:predicted nucleic acid-binding Zn ribbon protein
VTRREQEPIPLCDALTSLGRDLGVPAPDVLTRVVALWRDVVGSVVAEHAHVRSVRDGVCTVTVDAPVWATQLRYLEQGVIERANALLGPGILTSVKVVVEAPRKS